MISAGVALALFSLRVRDEERVVGWRERTWRRGFKRWVGGRRVRRAMRDMDAAG